MHRKVLITFIILITVRIGSASDIMYEDYDNILSQEVIEKDIFSNDSVTYQFDTVYPIRSIDIVGKTNEWDIPLKVEVLKNASKLVGVTVDRDVYKYFNVWTRNEKIDKMIIKYNVNSSIDEVKLYQWNGSEWKILDTNILDQENESVNFESSVDDIRNPSFFAIIDEDLGIDESVETITLSEDISEKEVTEDEEETVINEDDEYYEEIIEIEDMEEDIENPEQTVGFEVIITILMILLVYYSRKTIG